MLRCLSKNELSIHFGSIASFDTMLEGILEYVILCPKRFTQQKGVQCEL